MVYISRLIEEAFEEYYNKMILLSFNGQYAEDYFVIGVFDKKHLALAYALKELKKMKNRTRSHPPMGRLVRTREDGSRKVMKWNHDYYQQFEFKEVVLNEEIK